MSAPRPGPVRALLRRGARALPPRTRIRLAQGLARWRRRARARGGRGLADAGASSAPVLVTAVGVGEPELESCLEAVRSAGDAAEDALILTDVDAFMALRASGLAFEYVPPREDWERWMGSGYDAFVAARTAELEGVYGVTRTVAWSGDAAAVRPALRGGAG